MQQVSVQVANQPVIWQASRLRRTLKRLLLALLVLGLSSVLLLLVAGLGEGVVNRFFMHPPEINECLNHGGTWFYALRGCSD